MCYLPNKYKQQQFVVHKIEEIDGERGSTYRNRRALVGWEKKFREGMETKGGEREREREKRERDNTCRNIAMGEEERQYL